MISGHNCPERLSKVLDCRRGGIHGGAHHEPWEDGEHKYCAKGAWLALGETALCQAAWAHA